MFGTKQDQTYQNQNSSTRREENSRIQDLLYKEMSALDKTRSPVLDERKILEVLMKNPAPDKEREREREFQTKPKFKQATRREKFQKS